MAFGAGVGLAVDLGLVLSHPASEARAIMVARIRGMFFFIIDEDLNTRRRLFIVFSADSVNFNPPSKFMSKSPIRPAIAITTALLITASLHAQTPAASAAASPAQSNPVVAARQARVDLLRDELKQEDARIEARIDTIVNTLTTITDSKDSRTKVARMKEDTGKRLAKTITYYDQKRAALKEELRSPRLWLTVDEKQRLIAIFDQRIEKRVSQIIALNKSMPSHQDYQQYNTSSDWWGTNSEQNEDYNQNVRMTSHTNQQRDAIVKQLDASIARLDQQSRALKTQLAAAADPAVRKALNDQLSKTDDLIDERRKQKLDVLSSAKSPGTHKVALKQAMDMDNALQTAINDLRSDMTMLFGNYNSYIAELSALHATEASLAPKPAR